MTGHSINEPDTVVVPATEPDSINEPNVEPDGEALTIAAMTPDSCTAGETAFDATIDGTGFSEASVVYFGAQTLTPQFVDPTELIVTIDPSTWTNPADSVVPVHVRDSGVQSNDVDFTVYALPARQGGANG